MRPPREATVNAGSESQQHTGFLRLKTWLPQVARVWGMRVHHVSPSVAASSETPLTSLLHAMNSYGVSITLADLGEQRGQQTDTGCTFLSPKKEYHDLGT